MTNQPQNVLKFIFFSNTIQNMLLEVYLAYFILIIL